MGSMLPYIVYMDPMGYELISKKHNIDNGIEIYNDNLEWSRRDQFSRWLCPLMAVSGNARFIDRS